MSRVFTATSNISYILSQNCGIIRDFILSKFPEGFFKEVISNTEDPSVNEMRRLEENNSDEFTTKVPALAIKPVYNLETHLLENSIDDPWTHIARTQGNLRDLHGSYPHIYSDLDKFRFIFSLPKRHKLNFEINMRLESQLVLWDVLSLMNHSMLFESHFYLNDTKMAAVIPNSIIHALGFEYGFNLDNQIEKDTFLSKLRSGSYYNIDEIVDPAKGDSFYIFWYTANLLVKMAKPSGEVEKKNNSNFQANLAFTIETEFNAPTNFAVDTENVDDDKGMVINDLKSNSISTSLNFTVRSIPPILELPDGKKSVFFKGFLTDAPNTMDKTKAIIDKIELSDIVFDTDNIFTNDIKDGLEIVDPLNNNLPSIETSIIYEEGINTQKFNLVDNNYSIDIANLGLIRGKKLRLGLILRCDKIGTKYEINVGTYSSIIEFSQPDHFQLFEVDLEVGNSNTTKISILPLGSNENDEIYFAKVSIKEILKYVTSTSTTDVLYLSDVMDYRIKDVVEHNISKGIDNDTFFDVTVMQKDKKFTEDFTLDWNELKLTINNPLFNYTHYLSIYADLEAFKEILKIV